MTSTEKPASGEDTGAIAFLLVQLGFHAARRFAELTAPLGLEPRHVGMLTRLAANQGGSQQAVGELLGLNATRMVFLVDELEQRDLVERRRNPADRRSHALYLTDQGTEKLREVQQAGQRHEARLGAALSPTERRQLVELLRKIADEQGVHPHALPGPPHGHPAGGPPPCQ